MPCTTFVTGDWIIAANTLRVDGDAARDDQLNILLKKGTYCIGMCVQVPADNNRTVFTTSSNDDDFTLYITTSQSSTNDTLFIHLRMSNERFQQWLTLICPSTHV